jgi:hypothetical protein
LDALLFHGFEDAGGGAVIVIDDGIHRNKPFAYVDTVGADLFGADQLDQLHDPFLQIKQTSGMSPLFMAKPWIPMLDLCDLGEIDGARMAKDVSVYDTVFFDIDPPVQDMQEKPCTANAKQKKERNTNIIDKKIDCKI